NIQAGPVLDRRRTLRLRRRPTLDLDHAADHPVAHAMGELVGRTACAVHLGEVGGPCGYRATRPPSRLGHRTTQTRDLLTCSLIWRCSSPSTAGRPPWHAR